FPNIVEVLGRFKDGLAMYRNRRWDEAARLFAEALALNPKDKPSNLYMERSQYLKQNPPGDGWAGEWVLESK
ncbi:MAG: tetratricopeptide repeat protein, partial [Betaproteobacteria bacterium]|nr:tetratricopeptide repeat protein [Betaproteobacteria bacterium]